MCPIVYHPRLSAKSASKQQKRAGRPPTTCPEVMRNSYCVSPGCVTDYSSLITRHSSLITHHSSLVTRHSSLITHHSSLNIQHSTFNIQHSALNTQHSSFSTQHSALINPSNSENTCRFMKCRTCAAPLGQMPAQLPHPLHRASLTTDTFLLKSNSMAE